MVPVYVIFYYVCVQLCMRFMYMNKYYINESCVSLDLCKWAMSRIIIRLSMWLDLLSTLKLNYIAYYIHFLYRMCCKLNPRKYFNTTTLLNLYNTLILPFMFYCVHVWGAATDIYLDKNPYPLKENCLDNKWCPPTNAY